MLSKLLTKSDIEKNLLIPTCPSNLLPFEESHFFYMNVVDNTGNAWTFPCFIQHMSDDNQSKESSVISIGWLKFACKKDVRVGDMVFLHRKSLDDDNSTGTEFRIEVKRKIRLLGQDIWAAVDISNCATNNYI
ncbi:hypothetical protein CRYUN_Cryun06bG0045200 [Craigia yunnanensis]